MENKAFNIAEYLANYGFRKTDSIETDGDVYVKDFSLLVLVTDTYVHVCKIISLIQGFELRFSDQKPTSREGAVYLIDAIQRLS